MNFRKNVNVAMNELELNFKPLQVEVINGNFEGAFRNFKMSVQNDGILADWKEKSRYEKPSDKKKRKNREAEANRKAAEWRNALIASGQYEKRLAIKEKKRLAKIEARKKDAETQREDNG